MLTLPEAIRKMTAWPATRMRLANRGTIEVGNWADVTIFDLRRVAGPRDVREADGVPDGHRVGARERRRDDRSRQAHRRERRATRCAARGTGSSGNRRARARTIALAASLLYGIVATTIQAQGLAAKIAEINARPEFVHADIWRRCRTIIDAKKLVFGLNAQQLVHARLDHEATDDRHRARAPRRRLSVHDARLSYGTDRTAVLLKGDIVLVGRGDPNSVGSGGRRHAWSSRMKIIRTPVVGDSVWQKRLAIRSLPCVTSPAQIASRGDQADRWSRAR